MPSSILSTRTSWPGFSGLKNLVIFGDSLSSVTLQTNFTPEFHPTPSNPLAVEFPGCTYNEPDLPNWVGHLITKYRAPSSEPLLVYDYARGGDQVSGVKRQVETLFLPTVGRKPSWAAWNGEDSLFVTWVGTNDCAWTNDFKGRIEVLFSLQEELYKAGARNLLFIDVPPIHRSPAYRNTRDPTTAGDTFRSWNSTLRASAYEFAEAHPDCTVLIFSAYHTFNTFLDDLEAYGFSMTGSEGMGGPIWFDHLHPTSKVHDILARNLASFLEDVPTC